jgi:hypothetical protein
MIDNFKESAHRGLWLVMPILVFDFFNQCGSGANHQIQLSKEVLPDLANGGQCSSSFLLCIGNGKTVNRINSLLGA